MAAKNGEVEARRLCINAEREKEQITARIKQLDNHNRCLYGGQVTGRGAPPWNVMIFLQAVTNRNNRIFVLNSNLYRTKISEMDLREQYIQKFIAKS